MSRAAAGEWNHRIRDIARGWLFSDVPHGGMPTRVILPLENPDLHDHAQFVRCLSDATQYRSITIGTFNSVRVGIMRSKFGSPAVALAVETLADLGTADIMGVGFCGRLASEIACGELILPIAAVRDDAITSRYVHAGFPAVADIGLLEACRKVAASQRVPIHEGIVWSTDALLLETSELAEYWANRGVRAVDMECGALYTLARLRRVRAAAILVGSDSPVLCEPTNEQLLSTGHDAAIQLALGVLASQ